MIFKEFQVTNYRNIHDSGPVNVTDITAFVGQNEAGKSNLFEALYRVNPFDSKAAYTIDEDWPVDKWADKDKSATVCAAKFILSKDEIQKLIATATTPSPAPGANAGNPLSATVNASQGVILKVTTTYAGPTLYEFENLDPSQIDKVKSETWAKANLPKFVLVQDFELSGSQMDLQHLCSKKDQAWDSLSKDEQIILTILELAKIKLDDFNAKGSTAEGRTVRSFDKRAASAYLSKQFKELWNQKDVRFDIEIDGTTLNIFAQDEAVGMPVRLNRRSTGFRWHAAFAWKFTHASKGRFKDCILLLEEPGIHLHYSAQKDLLKVFEKLRNGNAILYTTHLASMVEPSSPERIRIVEQSGHHAVVKEGVVSSQKQPMAVIEMCLGLTGDMSSLLGNRKTLIVEGGDEALILYKISGLMRLAGQDALSDSIYLWPAHGASKTPMYAAFAIGQKWDSAVLLDSDGEGLSAKKKIEENLLHPLAAEAKAKFRVLMLGDAAKISKTDVAIEDIFPESFYLELTNRAYGVAITPSDLPQDGSTLITKRVEYVLQQRHGKGELNKGLVIKEMLKAFDTWKSTKDLPEGTQERAANLFKKINQSFGVETLQAGAKT
jgi:predicted ATP-dependent endonuclease of OLD family